jgi:hypothetical protein
MFFGNNIFVGLNMGHLCDVEAFNEVFSYYVWSLDHYIVYVSAGQRHK